MPTVSTKNDRRIKLLRLSVKLSVVAVEGCDCEVAMPRKDDIHEDDVEGRHSVGGEGFANILNHRIFEPALISDNVNNK